MEFLFLLFSHSDLFCSYPYLPKHLSSLTHPCYILLSSFPYLSAFIHALPSPHPLFFLHSIHFNVSLYIFRSDHTFLSFPNFSLPSYISITPPYVLLPLFHCSVPLFILFPSSPLKCHSKLRHPVFPSITLSARVSRPRPGSKRLETLLIVLQSFTLFAGVLFFAEGGM